MTADIVLVNQSSSVTAAELGPIAAAITAGLARDFTPVWGVGAVVRASGDIGDAWPVYILDHADVVGDLGYHVDQGVPMVKIFAADVARYGGSLCCTIDHEIKEMLVDPTAALTVPCQGGSMTKEICDPVPDEADGVDLGGGLVGSNFVYPAWFDPTATVGPFDARRQLIAPMQLGRNGYRTVLELGASQWQLQAMHTPVGGIHWRAAKRGRNAYRASL